MTITRPERPSRSWHPVRNQLADKSLDSARERAAIDATGCHDYESTRVRTTEIRDDILGRLAVKRHDPPARRMGRPPTPIIVIHPSGRRERFKKAYLAQEAMGITSDQLWRALKHRQYVRGCRFERDTNPVSA